MRKTIKISLLTFLALGLTGLVVADPAAARGKPRLNFAKVDTNADGFLTPQEISKHRTELIMQADTDGDGAVSRDEMRAAITARLQKNGRELKPARLERRLTRMFENLDANKDGLIGADEIADRTDSPLFRKTDADGDGRISKAELQARVMQAPGKAGKPSGQTTE
jgi:EF hand domain-containing protein